MTASSKWRAAFAATAASAVLTAVPVLGAQPAFAQYTPPPGTLTLSSTVIDAGDPVDFRATGFEANQEGVEVDLASRVVVLADDLTADSTGAVEGTVRIPERTQPGEHLFIVRAEDPDYTLSAEITVTGNGDNDGDHGGRPDHHGRPGHDHGGKPGYEHGGKPTAEPTSEPTSDPGYEHHGKPGYEHHGKPHLADTGEDRSGLLIGGAAGLLLLGGGAILLTRRVKRG